MRSGEKAKCSDRHRKLTSDKCTRNGKARLAVELLLSETKARHFRMMSNQPTFHLVTLEPPLLSGSIQDKANCDAEMTATPTERGGDGARVAVIPTKGAVRACVMHDHDDYRIVCNVGRHRRTEHGGG